MTQLVGILNVTPDSFSDGGKFFDAETAIAQAAQLFADGAALVDVGAESTRPGATPLTHEQEWQRLEHILPDLVRRYPNRISLDTYHPQTVRRALSIGEVIVNDVTGMNNPAMVDAVIELGARCIVSFLPAIDPQAAHQGPLVDDIEVVRQGLLDKRQLLIDRGLNPDRIILDPGIGFGKTPELNRQLLRFAAAMPNEVVMIGYSRKRFLGEHRMETGPNLEAGRIAIASGAAFLRVHDVAAHRALLG